MTTTIERHFLNEKISRKLFKNEKFGKRYASILISNILNLDYNYVYNNISIGTDDISFSAKTLTNVADTIYNSDKMIIDIEINSYNSERKKRQLESYIFQLHLGQLKSHKDYMNMKRIYQINIDNYDLLGKNDFIYEIYLMDKKYYKIVSDIVQIIHINLDYLRYLDYTEIKEKPLMKNLYVFICGNNNLDNLIKSGDELMKEIAKEVKEISGLDDIDFYLTDEEILELDRQDMIKEMRMEVEKEVRMKVEKEMRMKVEKEVRDESQKEMVKKLYSNGVSFDIISKTINLSIDEIKKIIEE